MASTPAQYPARFAYDPPDHVANWRPLVHWILVIPHYIIAYGLGIASGVLAIISWFAVLFTGRLPEGFANFQSMYLRYQLRMISYLGFAREEYPPFTFATTPGDPGDDPRVRADFIPALGSRNRLTTFFRMILAIPHAIVMAVLGLCVYVVGIIAWFAVLFTGRWPSGMLDFAIGVGRWWVRYQAYFLLLTDEYPPFTLD